MISIIVIKLNVLYKLKKRQRCFQWLLSKLIQIISKKIFKKNFFFDENCRRGQSCSIKVRATIFIFFVSFCFFFMYEYVYRLSYNTNKHLIWINFIFFIFKSCCWTENNNSYKYSDEIDLIKQHSGKNFKKFHSCIKFACSIRVLNSH